MSPESRPVVLVTGVGRRAGIAAGIVDRLATDGWDIGATWWGAYDDRMPWGRQPDDVTAIGAQARGRGARFVAVEADLEQPQAPSEVITRVRDELGAITALVLCHCEGVDSGILDTSVKSFDRHFAVNTRASWLLIKAYAEQLTARDGSGRIVALTSDHTAHNLPYGASKGALDRIVCARVVSAVVGRRLGQRPAAALPRRIQPLTRGVYAGESRHHLSMTSDIRLGRAWPNWICRFECARFGRRYPAGAPFNPGDRVILAV